MSRRAAMGKRCQDDDAVIVGAISCYDHTDNVMMRMGAIYRGPVVMEARPA